MNLLSDVQAMVKDVIQTYEEKKNLGLTVKFELVSKEILWRTDNTQFQNYLQYSENLCRFVLNYEENTFYNPQLTSLK